MTEACLHRLPVGKFVCYRHVHAENRGLVYCVIWRYTCSLTGLRTSAFDASTGEYITETQS